MVVAFQAFDCLALCDPTTMEMKPAGLHVGGSSRPDQRSKFTSREGVQVPNGYPVSRRRVVLHNQTIIHDKKGREPGILTR